MKHAITYILWGAGFGFILSRSGAARFDFLHDMFLFRSVHMYGLIGTALPVGMLGFWLIRRARAAGRLPAATRLPERRFHPGLAPGAALFGLGWGLSGTCPAPAIVQVGEGHWIALLTVAGILLGTWLYRVVHVRRFKWPMETCG